MKPAFALAWFMLLASGCTGEPARFESDDWVRQPPGVVLQKIADARQAGDFQTLRNQWERSQEPLGKLNSDERQNARIAAMNLAVALLDDPSSSKDCLEFLLRMRDHPTPLVRENLALALGKSQSEDTQKLLVELASDQDERVAKAAGESLAWRSRR